MDHAHMGRASVALALGVVLFVAAGVLLGCSVDVREGVFACADDTECPAGWTCRQPSGRCYRGPGQELDADLGDAGVPSDASDRDGGMGDGGMGDGGMGDGGPADGGPPDGDHDGVPDDVDCAPLDPSVGSTASRSCNRACGAGEEVCTDGAWAECDAPTTCDCVEGTTQTIPCGNCGTQMQQCSGDAWVDVGTCAGAGECAMGSTESEWQACTGGCGTTGSQGRTRTCDAACHWGAWDAWGACISCNAATEVDTQSCGDCGQATRSRSCETATCTWGAWSALGACEGQGVCAAGDMETGTCWSTACGTHGLRDRWCNDSCQWEDWGFCDCL